jgi:hypothetical protein
MNDKSELYDTQRQRCMYCGRRSRLGDMQADFITPTSKGGAKRPSNTQLLCSQCVELKRGMADREARMRLGLPGPKRPKGRPPSSPRSIERMRRLASNAAKRRVAAQTFIQVNYLGPLPPLPLETGLFGLMRTRSCPM